MQSLGLIFPDYEALGSFCDYHSLSLKIFNGGEIAESLLMILMEFKKRSILEIPNNYYEFISSLLHYGINLQNSSISRIYSFQIIESIRNLISSPIIEIRLQPLINDYGQLYESSLQIDQKIVKIAAFSVFDIFLSQAYQLFLTEPKNSFLAQTVLLGIRKLDDISLQNFVEKHSIITFLMNHNYNNDKITGQYIELALHLYRRNICSDPEWLKVFQEKIAPKLFTMAQSYGGILEN